MSDESLEGNPIDQIAEEFLSRHRRGEYPSISEFISRFPVHADDIKELFPALVLMEQARPVDEKGRLTQRPLVDEKPLDIYGEYRIVREIGRGGMGIVYEATQETLGRRVALKVLPKQWISTPAHAQRFQREARAAARLNHPNIVPVIGVGEQDGVAFYAMQFIPGLGLDRIAAEIKQLRAAASSSGSSRTPSHAIEDSLGLDNAASSTNSAEVSGEQGSLTRALYKNRAKYWKSVARIGEQVALALQYAADEGVVHRDIKPANLLMDLDGKVWVADFGLASETSQDSLTEDGDILGTIRYMAPERLRGVSNPLVDVYSLGATLYELVTLSPMFGFLPREQILQAVSSISPKKPRSIRRSPRI